MSSVIKRDVEIAYMIKDLIGIHKIEQQVKVGRPQESEMILRVREICPTER